MVYQDSAGTGDRFATELAELRQRIDQRLDRLLPVDAGRRDLVRVAMRESVLAPGKRLRPLMTLLAAHDLGCDHPALVDAGCAVELVHTASLLLDDLPCMDDATLRRGAPATHVRFGEDVAMLASIALLSQAFGLLSSAPRLDPVQRCQLVTILSDAVGVHGLVGGQYEDLRGDGDRSAADIAIVNDRKTGSLFVAALDMAAVVAGAEDGLRVALRGFGQELGRAFQILDDLLDAEGDGEAVGKDVRKDGDKATLLAAVGPEGAHRRLHRHVQRSIAALAALPGTPQRLGFLVRAIFAEAVAARRRRQPDAAGFPVEAAAIREAPPVQV